MCVCVCVTLCVCVCVCVCVCDTRVHAVAVPVPGCVQDLQNDMETLGVVGVAPTDILDVIEGYLEEGYGIANRELKGTTTSWIHYMW